MQSDADVKYIYKILLLGDPGVGKTSLLIRFIDNTFDPDYKSTIGVNFLTKLVRTPSGELIKLVIWDIAGQARAASYRHLYYRAAEGIILVYDVTSPSSFYSLSSWVSDALTKTQENTITAVIGNKIDLDRSIGREEGYTFAKQIHSSVFSETSAKTGRNVEKTFEILADSLLKRSQKMEMEGGEE
ncbi:MAG: GTP-binding protein [Promethearchaeota archaeon]|nr:MAG: GTP-binding protein [Candidatus Lokiarchaeota archaeon]